MRMWGNKSESSGISDSAGMLSLVVLCLGCCSSVLSGCHRYPQSKLQYIRNTACLVLRVHKNWLYLHWLPIVQVRFSQLYHSCLLDWTPESLHTSYTSDTSILYLPSVCMHSFGQKSFSYAAPSAWNSLIRHTFPLKSHLFKLSHWLCMHMCRIFDCFLHMCFVMGCVLPVYYNWGEAHHNGPFPKIRYFTLFEDLLSNINFF